MTSKTGRRLWRLTFGRRIRDDAIFNRDGEIAETWIESDAAARIKALVARGAYSTDEPLRLSILSAGPPKTIIGTVVCTAEAIAEWDPSLTELPPGDPLTAGTRSPMVTRLSVVRDVHAALSKGAEAGMLSQRQVDQVALLVRELLSARD
ncbi:hypothetical protein [Sphingomonas sp.]|uniref:hypothetical protein n=1 Tax=Sphingomonas sp. TaxID=28214 RepID=UPI002DD65A5F|nr:hypothetical protein [Sphingomonas sp.]